MTTNAFLFSWDCLGIESIVPLTKYEKFEKHQLFDILNGKEKQDNPVYRIIHMILLRAQINSQRFYEVYAIDCDESLTEEFWEEQWKEMPQETAELIRKKGIKLYSNRRDLSKVKIT